MTTRTMRQTLLVISTFAMLPAQSLTAESVAATQSWDATLPRGQGRTIDFVTAEGTWMSVDVSPDDQWIVFDLLGHIYRIPVSGGDAQCLTQSSGIAMNYHPRISPDGNSIVFVSDRNGQDNLWLMDTDGQNPRPLFLDQQTRSVEPTWTPDSKNVVFTRRMRTELGLYRTHDRIWRVEVGTGQLEPVAGSLDFGPMQSEFIGDDRYQWAAVSPDGNHVYYNVARFAGDGRYIQRKNLSTGQTLNLTTPKSGFGTGQARPAFPVLLGEFAPEMSPDGRWLTFARRIPGAATRFRDKEYIGRTALWIKSLQTGDERILMDPVTVDAAFSHVPWATRVLPGYAWTSDGKSIIITQGGKIRRLDVASGNVKTIPFRARVHRRISEMPRSDIRVDDHSMTAKSLRWPVSSPDGRHLVFEAVGRLWIRDLPDGTPRPLVATDTHGVEITPAWSHDGKWLAYVETDDRYRGHVYKVNVANGQRLQLTTTAALYSWPSWSPDDRSIFVNAWPAVAERPHLRLGAGDEQWEQRILQADGNNVRSIGKSGAVMQNGYGGDGRLTRIRQLSAPPDSASFAFESKAADAPDWQVEAEIGGYIEAAVPSPNGKWLALEWRHDIYILPTPTSQVAGAVASVDLDSAGDDLKRLSHEGGYFPHWRNDSVLEYVSANDYVTHNVESGLTHVNKISLTLERPVPNGRIALTGARVLTMHDREVLENATIVVNHNRLECVGDCDIANASMVFDAKGMTVMPGLTDHHSHHLDILNVPSGVGRSGVIERHRWSSAAYLAYGVTTVHDPAAANRFSFTIAEMIDAGRIVGPRTYQTGTLLVCMAEGSYDMAQRRIASLVDAREHVERQANLGAASIKDYKTCTRTSRQMLAEASRERGINLISEGGDLFYNIGLVMDGYTSWEHPLQYVPIYKDVSSFLGQAGAHHTPNHLIADFPQGTSLEYWLAREHLWEDQKAQLWYPWQHTVVRRIFNRKPLREYFFPILTEGSADIKRAGGFISVGDHGEQPGRGVHWEIWNLAMAMTPMEALETATIDTAHNIGIDKEVGSIQPGKLADLLILGSNPLDDIRNTIDIRYVMLGGRLYEGTTLDELWPASKPYGARPWYRSEIYDITIRDDSSAYQ